MAMDQTDGSEFSHVVDIIAQAKHIYIVGFRSSSFLAGYLNFYFRLIYDNVTQVQGGAAGTFDQLFRVGPGDVSSPSASRATPSWHSRRCSMPRIGARPSSA